MNPAINVEIADAIAHEGGDPALLTSIVTSRIRMSGDVGSPVVVLDASGNAETSWRDGRPVPATISDLVRGLKSNATFAPAFGGNGGSTKPGVTSMSAADWLAKTSAATPTERTALFHAAAAGKFVIGG